jgi:hypothetical protein
MRRLLPALLIAVPAVFLASGCGDDDLHWELARVPEEAANQFGEVKISARTTSFPVEVGLGCDLDDEARVDAYEVDYLDQHVIVTFIGKESDRGEDCLSTERRVVRLGEDLGDRALCDGSYDPPLQVFPGRGTPTTPKPGIECDEP